MASVEPVFNLGPLSDIHTVVGHLEQVGHTQNFACVINCFVGDITCCVVDYKEKRAVARKKLKFRLVSMEVINPRCISAARVMVVILSVYLCMCVCV